MFSLLALLCLLSWNEISCDCKKNYSNGKQFHRQLDVLAQSQVFAWDNTYKGGGGAAFMTITLIVPRAWEIGYMQPCIICRGMSATHFVYFWSHKTLPYTHLEATSYIAQQGQSLHIWTTSLSTTGCHKYKYTIQFLWMACISRFAMAILSGETELALGTIRVNIAFGILKNP